MEYSATQALALIAREDISGAEGLCLKAFENPEMDFNAWVPALDELLRRDHKDSAEALAWTALDTIEDRFSPRQALPLCGPILKLFSKNEEFRQRAVALYKSAYSDVGSLGKLIELSGLPGAKPMRRSLQTMDLLLGIESGSFLAHRGEGAAAKVLDVDRESWNVRVETPAGVELFDAVSLADQYEHVEADDFRILQQFDPGGFAEQLRNDPAGIVLHFVSTHADQQLSSDALEAMVTPQYLSSSEWSKWWPKARTALRKNPRVRLEGRNPVTIRYEHREISLEEELWPEFNPHGSPKAWLGFTQRYVRECKHRGVPPDTQFATKLLDGVRKGAATLERRGDAQRLAAWLAAGEIARLVDLPVDGRAEVSRVIQQVSSIRDLLDDTVDDVFWPAALDGVKEVHRETWPGEFASLLPVAPLRVADHLVEQITEAGQDQLLSRVVAEILDDPIRHVRGLCGLYCRWQAVDGLDVPPLISLFTRLLDVLNRVRRTGTASAGLIKHVQSTVRGALTSKGFGRFRECLEQIDESHAAALRTQVDRCEGLSQANKADLISHIRSRFPHLWLAAEVAPWEDRSVLFCTQRGLSRKQAELDELVNVKMKENAKAIGEAASHGDLSENSEYKFALEERDLLRARAAEIRAQLAKARVLSRSDVPEDHIGVGSHAEFRDLATGQTLRLTFLGPWESDLDSQIINYQAPISQKIMGLRVGDTVEMELGDFKGKLEVRAISCGLD